MSWVEWYTVAAVHVGTVFAVLFVAFFRRSPWRSTEIGKALMLKGSALAALFLVSIAGFWLHFPGFDYVNAAAVTAVVAGVAYQFFVMRRLQLRGRRADTTDGKF